jgi:colicin import membrane protein
MLRLSLMVLTLGLSSQVLATSGQGDERSEIAAQRGVLAERLSQQERECQSRFVVTACMDEARARHRSDMQALRDREWRLDQLQRQERASQKRLDLQRKQDAAASVAARPEAPPALALQPAVVPGADATPAAPRPPGAVQTILRSAPSPAQQQAAAQNAKAADQRAAKAAAAKARVKARMQQHEADMAARYGGGKTRPRPLPVPTAASAPSALPASGAKR